MSAGNAPKYISQEELILKIVETGQNDKQFKLGETIKYSPSQIEKIANTIRPADVIPVSWIEAQVDHLEWDELVRRYRSGSGVDQMRDILFRGKSKVNNEWIVGYYYQKKTPYSVFHAIELPPFGYGEVDPETVGQYTGIIDKYGVKIFEGDIVRADNGHIGYVVFMNGSFLIKCKCHPDSYPSEIYRNNETVIGNIYDNPELVSDNKKDI